LVDEWFPYLGILFLVKNSFRNEPVKPYECFVMFFSPLNCRKKREREVSVSEPSLADSSRSKRIRKANPRYEEFETEVSLVGILGISLTDGPGT
jgi:hypothetical protein